MHEVACGGTKIGKMAPSTLLFRVKSRTRIYSFGNLKVMEDEPKERRKPLLPAAPGVLGKKRLMDRLDGLAGMAWAYAVLHYSGMTARAAGIHFTPSEYLITDKAGHSADSGIFNQYLKGQRKPVAGPRGKNGVDLVAAVGQKTYGIRANSWLDHPLWKIFARDASHEFLSKFCAPDRIPLHIVPFLYTSDFSDTQPDRAPRIQKLRDFLYVCAFYRAMHMGGYSSALVPLIKHLVPQVCRLDPIFGYVHAPFVTMLEEYYFKTDDQAEAEWPLEMPPCVDTHYSDELFGNRSCPFYGTERAIKVCQRCESGAGKSPPEIDWSA